MVPAGEFGPSVQLGPHRISVSFRLGLGRAWLWLEDERLLRDLPLDHVVLAVVVIPVLRRVVLVANAQLYYIGDGWQRQLEVEGVVEHLNGGVDGVVYESGMRVLVSEPVVSGRADEDVFLEGEVFHFDRAGDLLVFDDDVLQGDVAGVQPLAEGHVVGGRLREGDLP